MVLVLLIALVQSLSSSDFLSELKQIRKAYEPDTPLSFHLKYRYYDDNDLIHAKDSLDGKVVIWKQHFNYDLGQTIFFKNEKYALTINKLDKSISVSEPGELQPSMLPIGMIDSLLKTNQISVEIILDNEKIKTYRIHYQKGIIDRMDFSFYPSTGILKNLVVWYENSVTLRADLKKSAVLKIEFEQYKKLNASEVDLSESKYIINAKAVITPALQYKEYTVSDNLNR